MQTQVPTSEITLRRSSERGLADHGWLRSRHTFSFADYYDPSHMGFRSLRVINDDIVAAGRGFPEHPHRDMEIFSYVLEGALAHRDSLGNERILKPGQIQLMSAGTGVRHSEFNPSSTDSTHFLQIWIQPREQGLKPSYTEWHPSPRQADDPKVLVISPDGREGSACIQQDAEIFRILLEPGQSVQHEVREGRGIWLQIAEGSVVVNGITLATGDAAATEKSGTLTLTANSRTNALLFDLH
jgi:redox-sensitive bicupin YhaK (pirin superfamily)